jgi:hypothetical protein
MQAQGGQRPQAGMPGQGPAADPLARTVVHAPPAIPIPPMPMQPGMMAGGPQPMTPSPMQAQPAGYAFGAQPSAQPASTVATMQSQQSQQAAGGNPLHMMRVEKSHASGQANAQAHPNGNAPKARPLPGAARPGPSKAAAPRLQPRAAPLPTPNAGGKKRMMYVGLFVVVALGLGAVVAKIVLKLF